MFPCNSESLDGLCVPKVKNWVTVASHSEKWFKIKENHDSPKIGDTSAAASHLIFD